MSLAQNDKRLKFGWEGEFAFAEAVVRALPHEYQARMATYALSGWQIKYVHPHWRADSPILDGWAESSFRSARLVLSKDTLRKLLDEIAYSLANHPRLKVEAVKVKAGDVVKIELAKDGGTTP